MFASLRSLRHTLLVLLLPMWLFVWGIGLVHIHKDTLVHSDCQICTSCSQVLTITTPIIPLLAFVLCITWIRFAYKKTVQPLAFISHYFLRAPPISSL